MRISIGFEKRIGIMIAMMVETFKMLLDYERGLR